MHARRVVIFLLLLICLLPSQRTFADRKAPNVVMMIGEDEYHTWETLPQFAKSELESRGMSVTIVQEDPKDKSHFPGIVEALSKADLLVLSVRRRLPPREQLEAVRAYLSAGKPLVGIRTACHAFAPQGNRPLPAGGESWVEFDPQVLGGHYANHYNEGPRTSITVAPRAEASSLLEGVDVEKLVGNGSLYRMKPLDPSCQALLIGEIPEEGPEPVAWTREYGPRHARVFYTSMGHPEDFKEPAFRRLLLNAMNWGMNGSGGRP